MPSLKMDELAWILENVNSTLTFGKIGTVPNGGFGIGIERMVSFAAGTNTSVKHSHSRMLHIKPY